MTPLIEVSENDLKAFNLLELRYKIRNDLEKPSIKDNSNFIYVPSINLYVAKQRTHLGKDWFECHKLLQEKGERMLILPEFIEFLKCLKSSNNQEYLEIYKDITKVGRSPRGEWLDADFKVKDNKPHINYNHILNYNHIDTNGILIPRNSQILDKNTLMQGRHICLEYYLIGNHNNLMHDIDISLEDYLINNHTSQGLPSKKVKKVRSGSLTYWHPKSEISNDDSVVRFYADSCWVHFGCTRNPSVEGEGVGVRAAKQREV